MLYVSYKIYEFKFHIFEHRKTYNFLNPSEKFDQLIILN